MAMRLSSAQELKEKLDRGDPLNRNLRRFAGGLQERQEAGYPLEGEATVRRAREVPPGG
jgi:hypothetical protein